MTASPIRWIYRHDHEGGGPAFRLGRTGDEVIAEWVGLGRLHASLDGTRNELHAVHTVDAVALQEVLQRHISALLRHLRGGVSLHASSVARGGVAVAFLGASCAGKSTIAKQLCESCDVELVSDDTAAIEFGTPHIAIVPSETDHSLRPDAAHALGLAPEPGRKVRKAARRAAATPARLGACVSLVFDDSVKDPVLRRVYGASAFSALSLAAVRFVLDDEELLRKELSNLARVSEQAPLYELRRSRDLSKMDGSARVADELLRSISGGLAEHRPG